ncbi:4-hydroxythreonine-4-phosphate dehydrogenase PdxA [Foetidibacter luteolus]|uniref:4-hydroxythreonine-4-phosphate dehydrogenase PdxA n=1 Tax=Foetidibacter luteolus TaxID=2608880 RepID=UPI00129B844E|nr:4-hydroxythreonine-4-phosphate dehydrogenase PdxA [Foetidibacter luteolus]
MSNELQKPVIGFTCGDVNGIGLELIIKSLSDSRLLDICVPVVFASNKSLNFYRKALPDINISYQAIKDFTRINNKQINLFNCWEEEVQITPGQLNEIGGKYALISLQQATAALKEKQVDALVTAPIHKKNIQSEAFNYSGHTPYLKDQFEVKDVVMIMAAENMRVALVTEHVPVSGIAAYITKEAIVSKLKILHASLQKDFGIEKPKIAVLGLNPHAGDEGLIGNEEETIIKPAIKEVKYQNVLAFGPYSADAFFARGNHEKFDAVLAMYHDQGLIPFKSLAVGEGVNYTAGLPTVRTSPDHGTAFDIAGKGRADHASFLEAIYVAVDIIRTRAGYHENRRNPLRKMSAMLVANAQDEVIKEDSQA